MGLLSQIEKIRQKPENIRMRYVWSLTAFSLIIVIFLWFWSFSLEKKTSWRSNALPSLVNSLENSDKQEEDVQNTSEMMKESLNKATDEFQKTLQENQVTLPDNAQEQLESALKQEQVSTDTISPVSENDATSVSSDINSAEKVLDKK